VTRQKTDALFGSGFYVESEIGSQNEIEQQTNEITNEKGYVVVNDLYKQIIDHKLDSRC
jgi:hypothetical protein